MQRLLFGLTFSVEGSEGGVGKREQDRKDREESKKEKVNVWEAPFIFTANDCQYSIMRLNI